MERRLAAILTTDVVGYSILMGNDEEGTHWTLKDRRLRLFEPCVARHGGRVVKLTGDGALVEFPSVVEALTCAIETQEANERENEPLLDDKRIRLRIGINLGDVMFDDGDVYGVGVNVAARLQTIAAPGGICISGAAAEQARGMSQAELRYLGWQELRNIGQPVEIYEVVPADGGALRNGTRHVSACQGIRSSSVSRMPLVPTDRPTVAVLPFESLGTDGRQRYFSDGITRDLTTELQRFHSLFVIASNSSFRFRDLAQNRAEIGLALGARYIVDGNVQRLGAELRVTAQLTDAEQGVQTWSKRYVNAVEDPTTVQDRLSRDIAANLNAKLESSELSLSKRKPPLSLKSYELWLHGAECHEYGGAEGLAKARQFYERAIAADPNFARPYARLAEIDYMESVLSHWGEEKDDSGEAWRLASRALELDPEDANGHAIVAWIQMVRHEFARAELHWRLSEELNPNDADIMMWRATARAFLGEPEAGLADAVEAMRLNPLHPEWYRSEYAVVLFFCRRFEEMLQQFDYIPELYPHTAGWRAAAYAHLGRTEEARDRAQVFARNIGELWTGPTDADAKDYGRWFRRCVPLRRAQEIEVMEGGLRGAGLF